jgi:hypothetical protein
VRIDLIVSEKSPTLKFVMTDDGRLRVST